MTNDEVTHLDAQLCVIHHEVIVGSIRARMLLSAYAALFFSVLTFFAYYMNSPVAAVAPEVAAVIAILALIKQERKKTRATQRLRHFEDTLERISTWC